MRNKVAKKIRKILRGKSMDVYQITNLTLRQFYKLAKRVYKKQKSLPFVNPLSRQTEVVQ